MALKPYVLFWIVFTFVTAQLRTAQPPSCRFTYSIEHFAYKDVSVAVEWYRPIGVPNPALLYLIHGSAGAFTRSSSQVPVEDNFGELTFARACFTVVLPHYLDALGRGSIPSIAEAQDRFPAMLDVLGSVLNQVKTSLFKRSPNRRIGVYGESLGGFLAAALASQEPDIAALSEFSGGIPSGFMSSRSRPKRALLQHGQSDTIVDMQQAQSLADYYRRSGSQVTLQVYPGQGHYLDAFTRSDVLKRTLAFFNACLKPNGMPTRSF